MEILLIKYGYLVLFLGVFVEGEAFLLAGAFLASRGYFSLVTVFLVALASNTLGAQFYYLAARLRGKQWFEGRFAHSEHYRRILQWMGQHGNWILLLSRFAFGFRIIIPAACGALGMPQGRFFTLNVVAGILWALPTAYLGYYFGNSIASLLEQMHRYVMGGIVVTFLAVALYLGFRHWKRVTATFQQLDWSDLHGLFPFVMGLMGVLNLVSALLPSSQARIDQIQRWLPLEVTQESRTLMLFAGIAILQVTRSLARRKESAWYVAIVALSISVFLHITGDLDLPHSLVAVLLLAYLLYFRRRFYGRSDTASLKRALFAAPLLTLVVFLYAAVGLTAAEHQFRWLQGSRPIPEALRTGGLILEPQVVPLNRYANRFLNSVQIAGWMSRVYILILLLRPVVLRKRQEAPREDIRRLFHLFGDQAVNALAVLPDKHHLLLAGGRGLAAYSTKGAVAVACGDPMASPEDFPEAVRAFEEHCIRHGWTPGIYLAAESTLPVYQSLGFASQKVAEEGLIDLNLWQPSTDELATDGELRVIRYDRAEGANPFVDEQLEEITEDWLASHHVGEMGFTIGRFALESLADGPVFLLGNGSHIEAFCAWLPYRRGQAMVLDLMRQRHTASATAVQRLLRESLDAFKESGVHEASISTVTLKASPRDTVSPVSREMANAFAPKWHDRFLVFPKGAAVSRIQRALVAVQFGRFRARWTDE